MIILRRKTVVASYDSATFFRVSNDTTGGVYYLWSDAGDLAAYANSNYAIRAYDSAEDSVHGVISALGTGLAYDTAIVDDDCADDDTGDWDKTDCTLTFDADHYEMNYADDTQYIHQSITTTDGALYTLIYKAKDGTAANIIMDAGIGSAETYGNWAKVPEFLITSGNYETNEGFMTAKSNTDTFSIYAALSAGNIEIKDILLKQVTQIDADKGAFVASWTGPANLNDIQRFEIRRARKHHGFLK
jgi:hypothetical protein